MSIVIKHHCELCNDNDSLGIRIFGIIKSTENNDITLVDKENSNTHICEKCIKTLSTSFHRGDAK